MLWYKAWLETRARFLTLLATVTALCGSFVYHALGDLVPGWRLERDFDRLLLVNQQILVFLWIFGVVLLGMGGIVPEKAIGTSSLTLALPVSRARLVGIRVGLGIIEAIALGVVPWTAVFIVSSLAGMPILITQVGLYLLLLVGGGLVYFAVAVLAGSLGLKRMRPREAKVLQQNRESREKEECKEVQSWSLQTPEPSLPAPTRCRDLRLPRARLGGLEGTQLYRS